MIVKKNLLCQGHQAQGNDIKNIPHLLLYNGKYIKN